MANSTATRLSPAELRRRLLAPPTDAAPFVPAIEEESTSPMPSRMGQRRGDASRLGGSMLTQLGFSLDDLAVEEPGPSPSVARTTPLPESRLDRSRFRTLETTVPVAPSIAPAAPSLPTASAPNNEAGLRAQNAELSRIIEEMRPVLEEASTQEERFQKKDLEFAAQVAEKDRLNEELLARIKAIEEQLANVPPPKQAKTSDELEEWSDELEQESAKLTQERRRIEGDRRQLHDDEESLEKQMREMEVSMARERAMMGRQETELKRLSAEIQHELEMLQRGDGTLRDQLSKFQRRHQEVLSRAPGMAPPQPTAAGPTPPAALPKDSGMLRRFFSGK